jgi:hypothetical protein
MVQEIRNRFPEAGISTFGIEMSMLTFRKDALLWRGDEDLRYGIQCQQDQWLEGGESVTKVHERRDEDEDVEHESTNIAQRHWVMQVIEMQAS